MYSVSMVDMAKTEEDVAKEEERWNNPTPMAADIQRYPYNLCISLTEVELEKLNLPMDAEVGDMLTLYAMTRVTSVSCTEKADSSKCCRIELQITHLAVEDDDEEAEVAA